MRDFEPIPAPSPSLDEVASAYSQILDHNERNSGFSSLFRVSIQAAIDSDSSPDSDLGTIINSKFDQDKDDALAIGEVMDIFHGNLFGRIGIVAMPLKGYFSEGRALNEGTLLPIVEDPKLYVNFISSLDSNEVQNDVNKIALMSDVIKSLDKIVEVVYKNKPKDVDQEKLDQVGENALRTFMMIDEAYRQLGLENPEIYQKFIAEYKPDSSLDLSRKASKAREYLSSYKRLEESVAYWTRGVLPEYFETGPMSSLSAGKEYYFDGGHDRLREKTYYVLSLLHENRTREFGLEASSALLSGIKKTYAEMEENSTLWYAIESNKELLQMLASDLESGINSFGSLN